MISQRALTVFIVSMLLLFAVACSAPVTPEPSAAAQVSEAGSAAEAEETAEFDPANFSHPTNIDNQWLPMRPGSQWIFEGVTVEDGEEIPHRIVFTVTDLTKQIDGLSTVVAWIEDYTADELVEAELAFYSQDDEGNVWYLGEYPEEYEEGEFVKASAWLAGLQDAQPGIKMKAEPRLGTASYAQGLAPAVNWSDRGQVYRMGQQTCVPLDCYGDVLVIDEFNNEEPGAFQQKYYARGVGNVRVGWRGEDAQQEELELVDFSMLEPQELAVAREAALALEERAYEISEEVYGQTPPSEMPGQLAASADLVDDSLEDMDRDDFGDPTNVDNKWFPMKPGTQWTFEGITIEDGEVFNHILVFTITDLIKEIDGIPTVVAWIEDYSNEQLIEAEIAFYAQDDEGNVWYLGEYPEEYENGKFADAPAWISGVQDAVAGILMPAEPQAGMPSVSQGWAPVVQWSDRGQVYRMGQHTCVPFDCFEDVLIMDEFNLEEPGAIQLKYYAPETGLVRVGFRGEDIQPEILELVEMADLDQQSLAEAREAALKLEERSYQLRNDVFGETPLAHQP